MRGTVKCTTTKKKKQANVFVCTRFCENETNVKVIQTVMGHADINTTMNIYAEVTEIKKQEAMENFSKNLKIFRERV